MISYRNRFCYCRGSTLFANTEHTVENSDIFGLALNHRNHCNLLKDIFPARKSVASLHR